MSLKSLWDNINDEAQKKVDRIERRMEMYSRMDDEALLKRWKSNLDTFDRIALKNVLEERGYHFSNNRDE